MAHAISSAGLALLQEFEGFRAAPAHLPDGNWVVGYGHVRIGEPGAAVSQAEAASLLGLDIAAVERLINHSVILPLNQSQFDALVSFVFSIGADAFMQSQVLRRVNSGDFIAAACAMDAWRKGDVAGELEVVGALVARRAAEKAMFLKHLPHDAAPSAFMRAKLDHAASMLGAPIKYAPAPGLGSVAMAHAKPAPAQALTEILKSEPAAEILLLTQVALAPAFDEEITTAHAKPAARPLHGDKPNFAMPRLPTSKAMENAGLIALMAFGLGLISIGSSMLFAGEGDGIGIAAGAAFAAPGLAATLMAVLGFWRGPRTAEA